MNAEFSILGSKLTKPSREMQLFLIGYILISICEIFTVGGIPLDDDVRKVTSQLVSNVLLDIDLGRALRLFMSVLLLRQYGSSSSTRSWDFNYWMTALQCQWVF